MKFEGRCMILRYKDFETSSYISYSHSNPPLIHSYQSPDTKIIKKSITNLDPNKSTYRKLYDQGNSKTISKSKTRNRIAITKNLTEKGFPGW